MSKKYQLKNGLTVILSESHRAPVVSVQMWVRTGSADEQKGEEGISHFIEHLVFKGTDKYKVGEIASIVEGAGGELNAYTSFDQTVFYVTLSKEFTETGLSVISEMMGFPTFDPVEVDNEREVVIEEIKRGKDSLGRRGSELLFSMNYKKHPYGIPVIGYDKNIRKWSVKKIKSYYQSRYVPKNMFLVVSGNFETPKMVKLVEKYFGKFRPFKVKKVVRKKEPAQTTPRLAIERVPFEQSMAYVSWKIPDIKHKDIPALDVLSIILGQGDSSRLVQRMRIQSALVNSVGASTFNPKDPGLFAISLAFNQEKLKEILPVLKEEILNAIPGPFSEAEIRKAVLNLESEEFFSMETVDGLSRRIGSMEFYFKDLKVQEKYIRELRKVTSSDLSRVGKKYINEKTLSVSMALSSTSQTVEKEVRAWIKDFAADLKKLKIKQEKPRPVEHEKSPVLTLKKSTPKTEKIVLKDGATLLLRPYTDTALVSVKMAMLGGARRDPEGQEGATELLGRTWLGGTHRRQEAQIYHEIESMAASLYPTAGRNSLGLGLNFISGFEKKAADLYFDVLRNSLFPEEVMEREKLVQLEQIKTRNDNPAQSAIRSFLRLMFPNHPYGRDSLGTEESMRKIKIDTVRNLYAEIFHPKNMVFVIAGNFDKEFWLEKFEQDFQTKSPKKIEWYNFELPAISGPIRAFEHSEKEQSHVVFGYRGLTLTDNDRYALQIIQSILAGQGGRLFIELRDKNSLAYSVSPLRMEGLDAGYFGAYIGCSPDKAAKAIAMIREQFDLLKQQNVGEAELTRAKRYIIGRHDIDLQRTSSVAAAILYDAIYGIDHNEAFESAEKYKSVSAADVRRVAEKIFSQQEVITVVGAQSPW